MTVITPVGGIIGPRPTGASFRTGVWKQPEVYERRVDGVWVTPTYPDLAPYATNANGEILVGTYNPGQATVVGYPTPKTTGYVKPAKIYPNAGLCLDDSRFSYLYTQAVTNSLNWRFDLRYCDQPTGNNVFGKTVQAGNVKRIASGNSCNNHANSFAPTPAINPGAGLNYQVFWWDELSGCSMEGVDYNILLSGGSSWQYTTTTVGGPSSSRWPFSQATSNEYVWNNGNIAYIEYSESNRPVSMWLLPP
jgi:hypothetical protein